MAHKRKFKAVLFDLDGVVIDSELYWNKIEECFALEHGLRYNNQYRRKIMALSPQEMAELFHDRLGVREPIKRIIAERNQMAKKIYRHRAKLLPGFLSLIKRINQDGYLIALVSSSPKNWIKPVVKRLNLKKWFDKIISADDLADKHAKPHPAIYLLTARILKVKPAECVVFEDSVNGVKAAKAAGMFCLAVPDKRWLKDWRGIRRANLVAKTLKDKRITKILSRRKVGIPIEAPACPAGRSGDI